MTASKLSKYASRSFRIALIFGVFYLGVCTYFWATQVDKILAPIAEIPLETSPFPATALLIDVDDAPHPLLPGLDAAWLKTEDPTAPTFLFLHGQKSTIGKEAKRVTYYYELGYNILAVEYRGFGSTFGQFTPSEQSILDDAEIALEFLRRERDPQSPLFIYGHSLGGAVAISLASRNADVAGLIVESTFTSILDMSSRRYMGMLNYLPVDTLLTERFDNASKLNTLRMPVLFIHGTDDSIVPAEMSDQLYEMTAGPKRICRIDGAGHTNCRLVNAEEYNAAIRSFIDECLPVQP